MISKKTVLILGAGASLDSGLPSGKKLIEQVGAYFGSGEGCPDFVSQLKRANPPSIDEFLAINNDNFTEIGKLGIAATIASAENKANLLKEDNWYTGLWHKIVTGCFSLSEFEKSLQNLFVVTFNYDRSLEHFLITSEISMYGENSQKGEVEAVFKRSLKVHHVYGQVGKLPWQVQNNDEPFRDYSPKFVHEGARSAKDILTFSEIMDREKLQKNVERVSGTTLSEINMKIIEAENVFFLGFAYHDQNLDFFGFDHAEHYDVPWKNSDKIQPPNFYGTMYGIGETRQREILECLQDKFKIKIEKDRFLGIKIQEFVEKFF